MKSGSKKSISFRIILVIVILILPMNIYSLYTAHRSQEIIIEHTMTNMKNIANLYMNELESRIQTINNFLMETEEHSSYLEDICNAESRDDYYIAGMGMRGVLSDHIATYHDAEAYFFYSDVMEHGMVVEVSEQLSKEQMEEALFQGQGLTGSRKWQIVAIGDTKWLLHVNHWKNVYIGGGIQLDQMENYILENMENDTVRSYIDDNAEVEADDRVLTVTRQCMKRDIYLHIQMDKSEVIRNLPVLQRAGIELALLELLIIPIMILIIRFLVLTPLSTVNAALNRLKTDPDARIQGKASTEDFDNVYRTFNSMADEIVKLKIDNYEHILEKQRVELRNLQLQIKPHFLFNSLNLMYNLVQMNEYKSVQKMLLYFSDYFRYINAGDSDFSLFGQELDLIMKYLEVAQIRYPDIFEVEYEVEKEAESVPVPQLLIHNFVENVIKHGLALKRKNHIFLSAHVEEDAAIFRIQDDGIGMPKEQAESINRGVFEYADGKTHLGLRNSCRRIRHYYGEKGSIRIEAEKAKGTTVIVRIPVSLTEEKGEG